MHLFLYLHYNLQNEYILASVLESLAINIIEMWFKITKLTYIVYILLSNEWMIYSSHLIPHEKILANLFLVCGLINLSQMDIFCES